MEEIFPKLYVGDDEDYDKAKENGFAIVSCCKDGPHGHRAMLKYTSLGAPKNKDYFFVRKGNHLVLNLVDSDDPTYIPEKVINPALKFIDEKLKAGDKVLVHCNKGHSRGPTVVMMYLRSIGDLPERFREAYKIFKTIYDKFDPGQGMLFYARSHWPTLKE